MILSLIIISGCKKNSNENTNNFKTDNIEKLQGDEKELDTKVIAGREVVKKYFDSLTKDSIEEQNKYCAKRMKQDNPIKIDKIEIISINEDKDSKIKRSYLSNTGTITKPYDVICFEVTYDIQYNKDFEKMASEPSGEKTKGITLVKESESSTSWLIDELGY